MNSPYEPHEFEAERSHTATYGTVAIVAAVIGFTILTSIVYIGAQTGEVLGWMFLSWPIVLGIALLAFGITGALFIASFYLRNASIRYGMIGVAAVAQIYFSFQIFDYVESCRKDCAEIDTPFVLGSLLIWGVGMGTHLWLRSEDTQIDIADEDESQWEAPADVS